ncbi:unnamed protein product [Anisakis simplex]|uniref:NPA domain-containing protein n=1 Tax=Anisakis simplex TaxID=6269 RepID=A0A0M3IZW8_ANISI|nr:unnamed protein product [Anisakis simplex]
MNLVWHFVCLALCVECTLARPPREKVEIAEAFVSAEDDELYEKVKNAEWEVKTERELSMGLFDIFRRSSRQRRSYDLHDWMTAEQKDEIRDMERTKIAPEAIRDKILVFYEELSPETKNEWDKKYKDHCGEWVKSVWFDSAFM